ncbi:MAG: hypothetical protein QGG39_17345 [Candidatus Poribacteria bacterium]|nr:hypothetical protein [Candidatus Poribacteria bacterium]
MDLVDYIQQFVYLGQIVGISATMCGTPMNLAVFMNDEESYLWHVSKIENVVFSNNVGLDIGQARVGQLVCFGNSQVISHNLLTDSDNFSP